MVSYKWKLSNIPPALSRRACAAWRPFFILRRQTQALRHPSDAGTAAPGDTIQKKTGPAHPGRSLRESKTWLRRVFEGAALRSAPLDPPKAAPSTLAPREGCSATRRSRQNMISPSSPPAGGELCEAFPLRGQEQPRRGCSCPHFSFFSSFLSSIWRYRQASPSARPPTSSISPSRTASSP